METHTHKIKKKMETEDELQPPRHARDTLMSPPGMQSTELTVIVVLFPTRYRWALFRMTSETITFCKRPGGLSLGYQ